MKRSISETLDHGPLICAEGYLFELERRGYLQAGSFVPEVALENPDVLEQVHRDFVKAGSDVVLAFMYNAHREKMRIIGKESLLEPLNRAALKIANKVKTSFDNKPFVAGNVSNTNVYDPEDTRTKDTVRRMFAEMLSWCVDEKVDYIVAETFYYYEEAAIALEEIKKLGLEAVVTLAVMAPGEMADGYSVVEACRRLKDGGADVVGLNCFRGPLTMMPLLKELRNNVEGHIAALPITYRTTEKEPTFFKLQDHNCSVCAPNDRPFPVALEPLYCNRYEIASFAKEAYDAGIRYLGLCCGAMPAYIREMAEAVGKRTINSVYSPAMEKHFLFGTDNRLRRNIRGLGEHA